jgi:hypothetical protein
MKKLFTALAIVFISGAAAIPFSREKAQAAIYYPSAAHILMSPYYLLPGQSVRVLGFGFWPGEQVRVNIFGKDSNVIAGTTGRFVSQYFVAPFNILDSTQEAAATGQISGVSRNATFKVGTFYPVVSPSAYYLNPGATVHFYGHGFAPNEPVSIVSNGAELGSKNANSKGNFYTAGFTVPASAGNWPVTFTGQWTHLSYTLNLIVAFLSSR